MNKLILTAVAVVAGTVASPVLAQTTVNFDQSTNTASYASQGLVLNGFSISNNTFGNAVNVPSSPNYASVDATGSFISFVDPTSGAATTSNGFGFTIPGLNLGGGYFAGATVSFFGDNGSLLGAQTFAPVGPSEFRSDVQYANALQGISRVVFTRIENPNGPALFPIDDVTFNLNAAGAGVPEPASWALMIGGFGLVGSTFRRRSSAVRFAV